MEGVEQQGSVSNAEETKETTDESEVESKAAQAVGQGGEDLPSIGDTAKSLEKELGFKGTKHKVKLDDAELEVDYDELIKGYQKAQVSDKKFQEASKLRKEVESWVEDVKKDAWKVFKDLGKDPYAAAEELLVEKLRLEMMSPAERRAHELEQKVQQLEQMRHAEEAQRKQYAEEVAKKQREALELKAQAELGTLISDAVEATGVKATPRLIARVAEVMLAHHSKNGGQLDPKKAAQAAVRMLAEDAGEYLGKLPLEEARKLLPKDILDAMRKADLDAAKKQQFTSKDGQKPTQTKAAKNLRKGTTDEIFERLIESKF